MFSDQCLDFRMSHPCFDGDKDDDVCFDKSVLVAETEAATKLDDASGPSGLLSYGLLKIIF